MSDFESEKNEDPVEAFNQQFNVNEVAKEVTQEIYEEIVHPDNFDDDEEPIYEINHAYVAKHQHDEDDEGEDDVFCDNEDDQHSDYTDSFDS